MVNKRSFCFYLLSGKKTTKDALEGNVYNYDINLFENEFLTDAKSRSDILYLSRFITNLHQIK